MLRLNWARDWEALATSKGHLYYPRLVEAVVSLMDSYTEEGELPIH
jgi:hypothetical protein